MSDRTDSADFADEYENEMTRFERDFEREIEIGEAKMDFEREERLLPKRYSGTALTRSEPVDREELHKALERIKNINWGQE